MSTVTRLVVGNLGVVAICCGIAVVSGSWQYGLGSFLVMWGAGACLVSARR